MNYIKELTSPKAAITLIALMALATVAVGALLMRPAGAAVDVSQPSASELPQSSLALIADGTQIDEVRPNAIGFSNGTVTVTRTATVSVESDHAILNLAVEGIADTVASARQSAAQSMTAVLEAVQEAGVEEDDIATTAFEIYPQTEWVEVRTEQEGGSDIVTNRSQIVGYVVRNGVRVTVRDLDSAGAVIDAAAEAAGDSFRVPSIRFGATEQDAAVDQARILAARDARRVAELHASTLGFVLGPVVEMTEYGGATPLAAQYDARVASAEASFDTPIVPGDVDASVTVEVKFAILGAAIPSAD